MTGQNDEGGGMSRDTGANESPQDQSWDDLSYKINSVTSNTKPKYKIYIHIDISK